MPEKCSHTFVFRLYFGLSTGSAGRTTTTTEEAKRTHTIRWIARVKNARAAPRLALEPNAAAIATLLVLFRLSSSCAVVDLRRSTVFVLICRYSKRPY
ncbi:unnamed protein product [Soboliphyme baturini]|uniref:Secreted protein n=1 Tax=Soboliphyme baturini TaxID=241478 RepID=A0A183IL18_9BILA|nr:unnamed protein product [Soboliphyme baturini]